MNFVHRAFFNAAARRGELYTPHNFFSKLNSNVWRGRQGGISERQKMGRGHGAIYGRFYGLGAVAPIDYGQMLMQPTASPGYTPPSLLEQAASFVKQAIPVYQQAQLLREQQKRRAAGLPPLTADQLAPTVRVQAGLDPGLMKLALYGAVGIGAALILPRLLKK